MVLNSNLQVPIPETSRFTHFWYLVCVPGGLLMAKNAPKMPILLKFTFLAITLIDLFDLYKVLTKYEVISAQSL